MFSEVLSPHSLIEPETTRTNRLYGPAHWPGMLALFAAAVWTAIELKRVSRISAVLFVPYIIWIGLAGVLNAAIVFMN